MSDTGALRPISGPTAAGQAGPVARSLAVRRRVRAAVSWLHLWTGLTAGVLFALIGLSGSVLVFHQDLLHARHPQLWNSTPTSEGVVLEGILERWTPRGLSAIDLPRDSLPVYQAYFEDETRRYFDPRSGELLLSRHADDDALLWLHELHTALLGGESGHELVGVIGWIALGMLLTGLYLWWPALGRILAQFRVYSGPPVRRWLTWHRSIGVISLPLLLLVTATGVAMIYHAGARTVLTTMFGGDDGPSTPRAITSKSGSPDWRQVLAGARAALPHSELTRLSAPEPGSNVIGFRARARGEWHPNGRSLVFTDRTGRNVLLTHDATTQPLGARMTEAIYPLHIGAVGGLAYRWLVALSGLLPAFMLVSGFLFWRRRRGKR